MKKNLLFLAAAVLASAVSCTVEEKNLAPETDLRVPMEFTAGTPDTKTELDPSSHDVIWTEDDIISIFDGSYNNKFTITSEAGGSSASFAGKALESAPVYLALYPYSATAECNTEAKTITSVLPSEQKVTKEATFAPMVNPSVAVASGNQLTFKNVASILQVNVANLAEGQTVTEISASADGRLSGAFTVDASAETPSAVAVSSINNYGVKLTPEGVTDLNNDGVYSYSLVVLPGSYSGLTVTVTYSDGAKSTFTASDAVEFPVSGGRSIDIDASKAEAPAPQTLYDKFMAGEDIEIGGKVYNKETYGDAVLVPANTLLDSKPDGNVVFVEDNVTYNYGNANSNNVIIGNNPEQRSTIKIANYFRLTGTENNDYFVLANVDILPADGYTTAYYSALSSDNTHFEYICIDNCSIDLSCSLVGANSNIRTYGELVLTNSDIKVPENKDGKANPKYIIGTNANLKADDPVNITIINNVIYSTAQGCASFRLIGNTALDLSVLNLNNNIFYNLEGPESTDYFIVVNSVNQIYSSHNIIYNSVFNNGKNYPILRCAAANNAGYPKVGSVASNIAYSSVEGLSCNFMYSGSAHIDGQIENNEKLSESPFDESQSDFDNGIFVPTQEYAEYGPQR